MLNPLHISDFADCAVLRNPTTIQSSEWDRLLVSLLVSRFLIEVRRLPLDFGEHKIEFSYMDTSNDTSGRRLASVGAGFPLFS